MISQIFGVFKVVKLFLGGHKMLLVAIAAAVVLSAVTLYVYGAEKAKGKVRVLEAQNMAQIATLGAQSNELERLTARIRDNNARLLEQIAAEEARVTRAEQAAAALRADRDRITAELGASRARWNEAIANDETLQAWLPDPVPRAVWDRLRAATGDPAR